MGEIRQRFKIGVKEEDGKHYACLIVPETGGIDYATPPHTTLEDALSDVHVELQLRYAAKGEVIEIKTKKELEDDPDFNLPDLS